MSSEDLASAFVRFAEAEKDSEVYESTFWAYDELASLGRNQPDEAWRMILAILSKNPGPQVIQLLAAGPLEDLLVENGALVIDEIERCAKSNGDIAVLLGGVWQSEIKLDVWKRIEKARSQKW